MQPLRVCRQTDQRFSGFNVLCTCRRSVELWCIRLCFKISTITHHQTGSKFCIVWVHWTDHEGISFFGLNMTLLSCLRCILEVIAIFLKYHGQGRVTFNFTLQNATLTMALTLKYDLTTIGLLLHVVPSS